ncbi:hypothetical protein N7540_007572 [Penicillium herquei]|nr:hypothetical protein N7540_007572 [Penicillium herquei]
MKSLQYLHDLQPMISKIIEVSGAAGASIGVMRGNEVWTESFGYRDIQERLKPDENTIYHLASLSKSFTATAIGILILPSFAHNDPRIQEECTVLDLLSHRTGLATKNALWHQDGPELLLDLSDTVAISSYLEVVEPFRSKWLYNNWGYALSAVILEKVAEVSWGSVLQDNIFDPLGMKNTYTAVDVPSENHARGYMSNIKGGLTDVGRPVIGAGTVQQGANGVKSSVSDLLLYYKEVISAYKAERKRNSSYLVGNHIPLDPESNSQQWYGAGWAIAELPAPRCLVLGKAYRTKQSGIITEVWWDFSALFMCFRKATPSFLVNSIAKNDCADWLGQLLLEHILENPDKNDYVKLAQDSAEAYQKLWTELPEKFDNSRQVGSNSQPLGAYVGRYYNQPHNWFIDVTYESESLYFAFQGRSSQKHKLDVYGEDIFSWLLTEEESRRLARWPALRVPTYFFRFKADNCGNFDSLSWVHDPDGPEVETFVKDENTESYFHDEL